MKCSRELMRDGVVKLAPCDRCGKGPCETCQEDVAKLLVKCNRYAAGYRQLREVMEEILKLDDSMIWGEDCEIIANWYKSHDLIRQALKFNPENR